MELKSKNLNVLVGFSVSLFILLAVLLWFEVDLSRPWKKYQHDFAALDKKISAEELADVQAKPDSDEKSAKLVLLNKRMELIDAKSPAIKQNWLTHFNTVDRCMSCHLGVEMPRFKDARQPFTTHSGKHIDPERHSVDQYGCIICHAGQGVALTEQSAHGKDHNWTTPFLPGTRAESSCVGCHPMGADIAENSVLQDAPIYSKGRTLFLKNNCLGCHMLQGHQRSKSIGPPLTEIATKTDPAWLQYWVKKPKQYLAGTVMPDFELQDSEINAMTTYLFNLSSKKSGGDSTEPLPGPSTESTRGKKLFKTIGCLGCHSLDGKDDNFGPDLSRLGEKTSTEWLFRWIQEPNRYWPETAMPNLRVSVDNTRDLIAYLVSQKGPDPITPEPIVSSTELIDQGRNLIQTKGCTGCHQIESFELGFNAPHLNGIGSKRVDELVFADTDIAHTLADWLALKVKNPRAFNSEKMPTLMPNGGFNDEETEALLTFLLSLKKFDIPEEFVKVLHDPQDPIVRGKLLVEQNNCTGCHKIGLDVQEVAIDDNFPEGFFWSAANYALEDITVNDKTFYAKGDELSDQQVQELLSMEADLDKSLFFHRWFVDYDTSGYLMDMGLKSIKLRGIGEGHIMSNYKDLNFAPPILHYEGLKVQQNWLGEFLDNPYPVRPLTKATMPTFNFSDKDISELQEFFAAKDGLDKSYFVPKELAGSQVDKAEGVFKLCLQCHYFDQERLTDQEGFGDLKGPNLAEIKRRLHPDYIKQWVKFPELIIPTTQMKNFFYEFDIDNRFEEINGDETGITDISQPEKIEMMSRFLMNPYKNSKLSIQR